MLIVSIRHEGQLMKLRMALLILLVSFLSCNTDRQENTNNVKEEADSEMVFNEDKWKTKEGADYPYRDLMLNNIVYNDTVRSLSKDEIINLLGDPDRIHEDHFYYMIAQKRLLSWPLHTKTMVIKFYDDNTIEWIKIHE